MHNYHLIQIKPNARWFRRDRIFYFQLGKRPEYEALIEKNNYEINRVANDNGFTFIFHKQLCKKLNSLDNVTTGDDFLNQIGQLDERQFYDELEYQAFNYSAIDPIYIVRKYNESYLLAWGYHAFQNNKNSGLQFPFEALLPLDEVIGEHCELDSVELLAKHGIYNMKT